MFYSRHVASGTLLVRREADSLETVLAQVAGVRRTQREWAAAGVQSRVAALLAFAGRLEARRDELARMVCEEVGRCLRECEAELDKSAALVRYYARLAPQLLQHQTIATQASLSQVRFEPLGVVLAVMPWNYPIWQVLRFAVPALCSGNACAVKPAPSVGRVSSKLFDFAQDLPLKPLWLATDDGAIENAIAATDALAFTGSTQTGRKLAAWAGGHLKKSVLELGGSNAFIVLPDADLRQAAVDACASRFRDAGQSCNAAKRLIVCREVADEFTELLLAECAKLQRGDPMHPDTTLAPLHRHDLQHQLHAQVEDALAHGAELLIGGRPPEDGSTFYPATVIRHINPACRLYHEEAFGPVASLLIANNPAHAIDLANDSPFGLGASIYSADTDQAWHWAQRLQTGSVFINRHTSSDLRLPFGGVKDSGFGRELSEFGLYEFVNVKSYWQK